MACASPISIDTSMGPIMVGCKQCLQCRMRKQSSIVLRCLFENHTNLYGEFWTLTYAVNPETLDYTDFSKFLKRLRIMNARKGNLCPIRFLGCGEYGAKSGRPHFHALVWNTLPTQAAWHERLWPHGFVRIGTVTPSSIRYTARYTLKFAEKGKEGMAHWSKLPPLGDAGIRHLAAYMRDRGDKITEVPHVLKIEGSTYSLDETTKRIFRDEFEKCGTELDKPSFGRSHTRYLLEKAYGDPIEAQRKMKEEKARFYETARFINDEL